VRTGQAASGSAPIDAARNEGGGAPGDERSRSFVTPSRPFDAVLLISFGGPLGPADVRPFLKNVLRGRRIPPDRVEAVAHHYELFGGVSPLTELTFRQAEGLEQRLRERGLSLPVRVGMRNWRPMLRQVLGELGSEGVRRVIGFPTAAHRSYSSCGQYKQNVLQAREALRGAGAPDVQVTYVGDWHDHPQFIAAAAERVAQARTGLPEGLRERARLVFTAHSIPLDSAASHPYVDQLRTSSRLVAERVGATDWTLVFQSRSGRPEDPWLEPDVNDYLRMERAKGLEAAILCPIGFICDHIEVLYDLDVEASATAREIGLTVTRAQSVNDHPLFLDAMADVVIETSRRYQRGIPLPLVSATHPNAQELPPPVE
jgi:protoporphyrin/coproporphyrin ferrochelatase